MSAVERTKRLANKDSEKTVLVSVCICTYRRPHLRHCLESVANQNLPDNCAANIIVVDNCPDKSAELIVNEFKTLHELDLIYLACPVKNLSQVRNTALSAATGDFIAMVDDDEVVSSDWIATLLQCSDTYQADIVVGPVHNKYSNTCPEWLAESDLMARASPSTGKLMKTGHAGNAILKRSILKDNTLQFDERLGRTGGEDTDFFYRLYLSGARIVASRDAIAYEVIDPKRENLDFLIQENKRIGQVFCRVFWPALTLPKRVIALARVIGKMAIFGLGFVFTLPFGKRFSTYWKLRYVCNFEKLRYLIHKDQTIVRYCV